MTADDNRGTADFLKEEARMKSGQRRPKSVKDAPGGKRERAWMTLAAAFGLFLSGTKK